MFIAIGKVARLLGVSATTLRRWDKANILRCSFRTVGGHRRYRYTDIQSFISGKDILIKEELASVNLSPHAVTYARVSAAKQKADLHRQELHLQEYVTTKN